jgi:hypothetical protein
MKLGLNGSRTVCISNLNLQAEGESIENLVVYYLRVKCLVSTGRILLLQAA